MRAEINEMWNKKQRLIKPKLLLKFNKIYILLVKPNKKKRKRERISKLIKYRTKNRVEVLTTDNGLKK